MNIHVRKYLDEALGLGIFMCSAAFFDALIYYPGLAPRQLIDSELLRRFLVGLAMGLTALYIFTSKFGKQSGAYINPAVTFIRWRLGDINWKDAIGYCIFQCAGGIIGIWIIVLLFPAWMKHPEINYIVTVPGKEGIAVAFLLEAFISFLLITVVLLLGRKKDLEKYTPIVVAILITIFITFEAPYSGMSMNPARTLASAVVAGQWTAFWLYCTAPVVGMLLGEQLYKKSFNWF